MGDEGDRQTTDRRQFDTRLVEFEGRLRAVEREPLTAGDRSAAVEAELRVLREALDDLASDVVDLHNQQATLVSACERILAGAAGRGLDISLDRGIGGRGSAFVLRRAARRVARASLGAARRMLGSGGEEESVKLDIEVKPAAAPATRSPSLTVVVQTNDDPHECDAPAFFGNQTDLDTDIVVWNPESGIALVRGGGTPGRAIEAADRGALVEAIGADFIAEPMNPNRRLLPTVLEMCRWTLASEGLPLIVGGFPASGRSRTVLTILDAQHWCDAGDPTASPAGPAVVKHVGSAGRMAPGFHGRAVVWGEGRGEGGYLLADTTAGVVTHEVAALEGVVSAVDLDDSRPHVLVLTPLSGGAFEAAMWLIQGLRDAFRFSVVLTEDCSTKARLARAMAEVTPAVYPLANFLEPSVWSSAVLDLVRARKIATVLRIGGAGEVALSHDEGPRIIELPLDSSEIGTDARTLLALGEGIAGAAARAEIEVIPLTAAPTIPPTPPDSDAVTTVRSGLGIPGEIRLVVGIADLVPEHRPEDFVAVANRLRHRPDIHFLLVGEGELAGTVSDIARYFGLENLTLAPQTHGTFELVLAADIVMSTAERDPWPTPAAAALALGRCLVATDVEGRRELAEGWAEDRTSFVQPGDIVGLAGAIEAAVDGKRKPRATKKAWNIARARTAAGLRTVAIVLNGRPDDSKGDS